MDHDKQVNNIISLSEKRIAHIAGKEQQRLARMKPRIPIFGFSLSKKEIPLETKNNNVIGLVPKRRHKAGDGTDAPTVSNSQKMRVLAITSGKGGVGKTNVVANLGFALSQMGKRVLILDADLGLGNLDILLGITPKYNLSHVIAGEKDVADIAVPGPGSMQILPAASGIEEVTRLTKQQRSRLMRELQHFTDTIDVLLVDTAAGISSNVMSFNKAAHEILVVVSPEPTSITDAYALMKVLSLKYETRRFRLLVNMAANMDEAFEVFRQIKLVTNRFLDISIDYLGYILLDRNVARCVRRQKIVTDALPAADSSQCFYALARKIFQMPSPPNPGGGNDTFWKNIFSTNGDESA